MTAAKTRPGSKHADHQLNAEAIDEAQREELRLDEALEESFPASDPAASNRFD